MTTDTMRFDASELCSRKLWQLVNTEDSQQMSESELQQAIAELTSRRHYLAELARLGKLEGQNADN